MLATLLSATLHGLTGRPVRVEVDVAPGLPGFTIVGLPDAALTEARERVRGALRNSGFIHPPRRITVNLAPAELRKGGASLDLAIALGILLGSDQLTAGRGRPGFVGELSLGGEVRRVPGLLPMVIALAARGTTRVVVPADGLAEARLAPGVDPVPVETLAEAAEVLWSPRSRRPLVRPAPRVELGGSGEFPAQVNAGARTDDPGAVVPDLAEVRGQAVARRALEVALAGGHALLLVGPPGSGKTLLARTIPRLLPDLADGPALAATQVASVASDRPISALMRRPPVRTPHHTTSYAGMVGGGTRLSPGEITLADQGVLVLDELPEFGRDVLEALRQPLEEGRISVVRVGRAETFPARFTLVAAMNPCPCGQDGSAFRTCSCPPGVPERYRRRVSGPLRDRFDLWVVVDRVAPEDLVAVAAPEGTAVVAARIAAARARQRARSGDVPNGRLSGRALRAACRLDDDLRRRAIELAELDGSSGRGMERVLRVARTIADLAGEVAIGPEHLAEAARFRAPVDRAGLRLAG